MGRVRLGRPRSCASSSKARPAPLTTTSTCAGSTPSSRILETLPTRGRQHHGRRSSGGGRHIRLGRHAGPRARAALGRRRQHHHARAQEPRLRPDGIFRVSEARPLSSGLRLPAHEPQPVQQRLRTRRDGQSVHLLGRVPHALRQLSARRKLRARARVCFGAA